VIKTPIHDAGGRIIGIQCIFWDITERKQFEERLQKANEELRAVKRPYAARTRN